VGRGTSPKLIPFTTSGQRRSWAADQVAKSHEAGKKKKVKPCMFGDICCTPGERNKARRFRKEKKNIPVHLFSDSRKLQGTAAFGGRGAHQIGGRGRKKNGSWKTNSTVLGGKGKSNTARKKSSPRARENRTSTRWGRSRQRKKSPSGREKNGKSRASSFK